MKFNATLKSSQQVPPVNTTACGQAVIKFLENKNAISSRLSLRNIQRVFQAHIHMGRRGTNGPANRPNVQRFSGKKGKSGRHHHPERIDRSIGRAHHRKT